MQTDSSFGLSGLDSWGNEQALVGQTWGRQVSVRGFACPSVTFGQNGENP